MCFKFSVITANFSIFHQLRYVYAVRWILWDVAVKIWKVHYLEIEVFKASKKLLNLKQNPVFSDCSTSESQKLANEIGTFLFRKLKKSDQSWITSLHPMTLISPTQTRLIKPTLS